MELLIGTTFLSILMAMSYTFTRAALTSARIQEVKSEAQEVTVMALDIVARELRMAGFNATGGSLTAVRSATGDRVEVASDFNGDGDVEDTDERIAYSYDEQKHALMRATGGGSPQPLVRNLLAGGAHFAFFDAAGDELLPGNGGLSLDSRRRVRRIDVTLAVELSNPAPGINAPLTSIVGTSIYIRNHGANP